MATGRRIRVTADDGHAFDVHLCGEAATRRTWLLMFTPIFGLDDESIALADGWAAHGHAVATPDYFARAGAGVFGRDDEGRKLAFARWQKLDVDRAMLDAASVVKAVAALPGRGAEFAALGYCAGGEYAWLAATRLGARGAFSYHGTHIHKHLAEADRIKGPVSLHYGGDDPLVPHDQLAAIQAATGRNPHVEVHVYGDTPHGFMFPGRPSWRDNAAKASQSRTLELLATLG